MSERQRLDTLVYQRGLAPSRAQAQALILAGAITVDGRRITQAGTQVPTTASLACLKPAHRYVSRGGDKLAAALDAFHPIIRDRVCLDIGASTGGFTDCLLQAGARRVYAIDVGYGQLDWRLRTDARVVVYERTNARYLQPQDLPERAHIMTVDASFISLRLLLPTLVELLEPHAEVITLIKPQFEVGKGQVGKGGVVRDPQLHGQALWEVLTTAQAYGLGVRGGIVSPLLGPKGNREFLVYFGLGAAMHSPDVLQALCRGLATGEGIAL
jgi:23S rRNA (cytidine1920-2'-O)/16S rRNA (cytidine1409-2'-O)-methyltransferase